jgi:signal transduction histidine kinase
MEETVSGSIETIVPASSSPADKAEALRRVEVFADLPDDQLQWFAEHSEDHRYSTGDVIFRKGDKPEWMVIYLEGEIHAYWDESDHDQVYIGRAGDRTTEVSGRAVTDVRLLRFPVSLFPELMQRMPVLGQRLVGIMSDRVREATTLDQQQDKLMALGKLSAGLAHELNNPAAGATRAANDLIETLKQLRVADMRLCAHDLTAEQQAALDEFESKAIAATAEQLNSLEQSDREDEVSEWLESQGIAEPWRLSANLVEAGIDSAGLVELLGDIPQTALVDVLSRVNCQLAAAKLANEIRTSTTRISELVKAIKEYSYMDQASVQEVDIHNALDNTLLILKYKLRKKNITVTRDYAESLPQVKAYGSELNQVWTNLIVNAVDAMSEGGKLKVRTKREPTDIMVEIRDTGVGIPPSVRSRIFEPFFTTKTVGEGTGLGLDTVARIVRKHRGNVRFESRPGDTCFQVRLPIGS